MNEPYTWVARQGQLECLSQYAFRSRLNVAYTASTQNNEERRRMPLLWPSHGMAAYWIDLPPDLCYASLAKGVPYRAPRLLHIDAVRAGMDGMLRSAATRGDITEIKDDIRVSLPHVILDTHQPLQQVIIVLIDREKHLNLNIL